MLIPRGTVFQSLWTTVVIASSILHSSSLLAYSSLSAQKDGREALTLGSRIGENLAMGNLAWTFILALLAFWILAKILNQGQAGADKGSASGIDRFRTELPRAIRRQPLQTLTFFLLSFAYIMYSTAFSLALHDRLARLTGKVPSLHMEGLSDSRQMLSQEEAEWCARLTHLFIKQSLRFERNSPSLELDLDTFARMSRKEGGETGFSLADCYSLEGMSAANACSLHNVVKAIACYGRDATVPVTLLSVTGLTEQAGGDPRSASQAEFRARQVDRKIRELFPERYRLGKKPLRQMSKIELSIGAVFLDPSVTAAGQTTASDGSDQETVQIQVGPLPDEGKEWLTGERSPELLDYLYFTVYTITTTGYGDIQPKDGFAKFVTSLANLYELFYIVIFFNVLISASRERGAEG